MKPRANLGNRTRQPKGCANRIAKPARLGRASQNHLMMIVLNKTGATTVAQLKATGIQQCNNAKTAPFQRFLDTVTAIQNLLPAAFGVSTREPAALFFVPGGGTPPRGCLLHGATLERLCDCVLACRVVSRRHVPLYAIVAVRVVATSWLWLCRVRRGCDCRVLGVTSAVPSSPSCGCGMPTNASVCNGFDVVCVVLICLTFARHV